MRMTRGWTGLGLAFTALTLGAAFASEADAAAIMNYSTVGTIDSTTGVDGFSVIGFNSVTNGSFIAPSSVSLGEFQIAGLAEGNSTTYTNTPFNITYLVNTADGVAPTVNQTPVTLKGVLNGTVTGAGQSNVVATFDTASLPPFQAGEYNNMLEVLSQSVSLVPSTSNGGRTTVQARLTAESINPPPIPEPTTAAIFLTAIAGMVLRRRLRAAA